MIGVKVIASIVNDHKMILGDINMHIDNMKDQDAQMLLDSLVAFNLTQHVKIPADNKGHPLDVISTPTEDGPFLPTNTIAGPYISDHGLIILGTTEIKPETKIERQKIRKINGNTMHKFCVTSAMTQSYKQQHLKRQPVISIKRCSEPST